MKLIVQTEKTVHREEHSGERYGSWSKDSSFRVQGVYLPNENKKYRYGGEEFEVPFDVKVGDDIFVLSMTYSSGDSFGSSRGNGSVVALFKTSAAAYNASAELNKNSRSFDIKMKDDDGNEFTVFNDASGYFESLEYTDVSHFRVQLESDW